MYTGAIGVWMPLKKQAGFQQNNLEILNWWKPSEHAVDF
jgi:hypothetical protein